MFSTGGKTDVINKPFPVVWILILLLSKSVPYSTVFTHSPKYCIYLNQMSKDLHC